MSAGRLLLIRHAATGDNGQRFIGREDLPVSATGHVQIAALSTALAGERIDVILCSPLRRAIATAKPLATGRGLALSIRPELIEIDFGRLQGTTKGIRPLRIRTDHLDEPLPGGESLRQVGSRLAPVAQEIAAALAADCRVAVVAHYWSNRVLLAVLSGGDLSRQLHRDKYKPANASAFVVPRVTPSVVLDSEHGVWLHAGG